MSEEKVQVGMTHPKSNFSEWFSEAIAKTELCDMRYNAKGFVVFRPWAVRAMMAMYRLYEAEMMRTGHEPAWFPAVIPEENFTKESEHVEGFAPEVFWITEHGAGEKLPEKLAMRPTSETAMYRMYSKWIRSWRDLPLKVWQSCQVWRYETKATRPFIRSREFYWLEGHDVFATREEAEAQVKEDMGMTESIMHREFGVPFIPFKRPVWDMFPGTVYTCAADTLMPDGKVLQQPSTHMLGQNFAIPFEVKFEDKDGKEKYGWQTCYGPCISRMMASVVATHGDDRGLKFPFKIAPLQAIIIPRGKGNESVEKCKEIEAMLISHGIRVKLDDSDKTAGWKFNHWEMRGVPIRIEVGPREMEEGKVTLYRRDTGEKKQVHEKSIAEMVEREGAELTKNLLEQADKMFEGNIHQAKTMEELEEALKKGGFVKVPFCTMEAEGKACAEQIKEKYHAEVRGERQDIKEKAEGNCIVCNKPAKLITYIAKQY